MRIFLAVLTLILTLALMPSFGVPAAAGTKGEQKVTDASPQGSGKKISPQTNNSKKSSKG